MPASGPSTRRPRRSWSGRHAASAAARAARRVGDEPLPVPRRTTAPDDGVRAVERRHPTDAGARRRRSRASPRSGSRAAAVPSAVRRRAGVAVGGWLEGDHLFDRGLTAAETPDRAHAVGRGHALAIAGSSRPTDPTPTTSTRRPGGPTPRRSAPRPPSSSPRGTGPCHIDSDAMPAIITTKPSTRKTRVRPIGACASSRRADGLAGDRTGLPGAAALDRAGRDAVGVAVPAQQRVEVAEEQRRAHRRDQLAEDLVVEAAEDADARASSYGAVARRPSGYGPPGLHTMRKSTTIIERSRIGPTTPSFLPIAAISAACGGGPPTGGGPAGHLVHEDAHALDRGHQHPVGEADARGRRSRSRATPTSGRTSTRSR